MTDTKLEAKSPKGGRWLRRIGLVAGAIVVLLVALYFVATSSGFVKSVIVPKIGAAMNAEISLGEASVSPFSQVVLHDVKVTPKGAEPLLTATEVRARYSLWSIIGGKIVVDEVAVVSPTITVIQNADGTSNLDPLTKKDGGKTKEPPKPATSAPGKPPVLDVKSVAIKNATIRLVTNLKEGGRDTVELANANLAAANIKNGQTGKLDLSATIAMDKAARKDVAAALLGAKVAGAFTFDLTEDLKPKSVKGGTTLTVEKATGAFADFNTLTAKLDCEATPTEVRQLALRFTKGSDSLGEVKVSGPFDGSKQEGKLKVEVASLDRKLLNLAGAANGIDFGTTTVSTSNDVELRKGGEEISLAGRVDIARFQVTRQNQTTPTLDLRCDYDVLVDRVGSVALLKALKLAGTQNQQQLLQADLTSPMTIAWGDANNAVGDATLNLALTGLNLADWKAFAGEAAPTGVANAKLKLLSQKAGKQLTFELEGKVDSLSARFGSNQISQADIRLQARGGAAELKQFKLEEYRLEVAQQGQTAVSVSGSGTFDSAMQDADLQVVVQATLTRLLALLPQPGVSVTAGMLDFKGRVASKDRNQTVAGQLALTEFTGKYGEYRFAGFGTTMDFDVVMKGTNTIEIRKAAGQLREGQNNGGNFEATGNYDLQSKAGQFSVKLVDFNQNGLRPFLESALGDKKLVSVTLNTTASATLGAGGDAAVKADTQVANLVVSDPKGAVPATPLEARVQVDTSVAKQVAQVRQCQLTLTPTERAKNQLDLTGTVDFSKSNALTGNLKLASESLDVTRYYDLFAGKAKPTETGTAPPPSPTPTPADPNKEPDPVKLPLNNFAFDASIGRFYLHEVEITNLQTTAKLDASKVLLKPFQLSLNGAPVSATVDLDLSNPGYQYDVAFNANAIPLAPLVNTFVPERKGQIHGTTTASAAIKGAGTTGANLQKNLAGQFSFLSTNMNLSIANVRSPLINSIINVVIGIPDLIQNPTAAVGNLLASLTKTGGGSKGGWADQLTAAPIDVILATGKASAGRVTLDQAEVRSSAFQVLADGNIGLAPILTNSTIQIPVYVSLSRALGDKIGLVSANTPTNAVYVPMPQFLTMKGTLGNPEKDINKIALIALAAKAGGGIGKNIGGAAGDKVGGVLNLVGGVLGGGKPAVPATNVPSATATNAPPANVPPQNPVNDLLNLFKKPKK